MCPLVGYIASVGVDGGHFVGTTAFPRSGEFSSAGEERRRWRSTRRSKPGKERLPRGRRVAQAPGMVAFASLMRTNSLLDLPFLRTVPHSDPKHNMRITRQDTQGDVQTVEQPNETRNRMRLYDRIQSDDVSLHLEGNMPFPKPPIPWSLFRGLIMGGCCQSEGVQREPSRLPDRQAHRGACEVRGYVEC
ncbi:hypothetical protein EYF80_006508 [Liparis tanakae]|uniref:Uncharacterized protein n=1 Tax=Liparis tanakae TaxID=230148 RepID=A0A4Z2IYV1_9TELE|nr:hypothetical protein EYF80_006508 [Liparis tanakae]